MAVMNNFDSISSKIRFLISIKLMKQIKADGLMVVITLFWGFTFIFTKIGLESTNESLFVLFRFSLALLMVPVFFKKHLKNIPKDTIKNGIILGLFFGGGFVLQTYGLKLTTVPKSAFITGLAIPLVPFVYKLLVNKPVGKYSLIAVLVATIGLWLFSNPDFNNLNFGDILTLFSTLFWAFYITYIDILTKQKEGMQYTAQLVFIQFLIIIAMTTITFFIFDFKSFHIDLNKNLIIALLYNGLIASFIVTFLHTAYQKFTNPVKAALIFSLEPVIASVASIFVFGIVFSTREILGAIIMIVGVLISEIAPFINDRYFTNKLKSVK